MNRSFQQLRQLIESGAADHGFVRLYGTSTLASQKQRYRTMLDWADKHLSGSTPVFISAPGRTELGGNHTDHNNGRVLAAAVDLDCVALVCPNKDMTVNLFSDEFDRSIRVDLTFLEPQETERETPEALVRGVAHAQVRKSLAIRGFSGIVDSTCKPGSGLSSSAAFSVLAAATFAKVCANHPIDPVALAQSARYAENVFFGKPCGLMDQMSSAVGEIIGIDFKNPEEPVITRITADFDSTEFQLVIVDTGSSHAELTHEYAAIPAEISQALKIFNRSVACGLTMPEILHRVSEIRTEAGDRALLRLMHFVCEDERTGKQSEALQQGRIKDYLELVRQSGESSCNLLQNCVPGSENRNQGILLALALTKQICPDGYCRVHGGGFAGTIQAYIPRKRIDHYERFMKSVFGDRAVIRVRTGRPGISVLSEGGWHFPTDER